MKRMKQIGTQIRVGSKYRNIKTNRTINGEEITFDSKKEAARYDELTLLERAGLIRELTLQPRFTLQESFVHKGKTIRKLEYVADFSYLRDNDFVVEDVKSEATKTPQYRIKKKLMLGKFGIEVVEV